MGRSAERSAQVMLVGIDAKSHYQDYQEKVNVAMKAPYYFRMMVFRRTFRVQRRRQLMKAWRMSHER